VGRIDFMLTRTRAGTNEAVRTALRECGPLVYWQIMQAIGADEHAVRNSLDDLLDSKEIVIVGVGERPSGRIRGPRPYLFALPEQAAAFYERRNLIDAYMRRLEAELQTAAKALTRAAQLVRRDKGAFL
jgi:hypothetical protein